MHRVNHMKLEREETGDTYSFCTRFKSFSFNLNCYGTHVIIRESCSRRTFTISIDAEGCYWLASQLLQIMGNRQDGEVFRTFRKGNYRLTITKGGNKAGEFLKLMKVENGTVKSLMIPKERNGAGWSNFYVYINGFFKCEKLKMINAEKIRVARVSRTEDAPGYEMIKDWKMAMIIFRSNTRMSWYAITRKLEAIIKRKAKVNQVVVDRAIFYCVEVDELKALLMNSEQLSSPKTLVRMVNWKKEDHWENYK